MRPLKKTSLKARSAAVLCAGVVAVAAAPVASATEADAETQDAKAEEPASPDLKARLIGDLKVEPTLTDPIADLDAWRARKSSRHSLLNLPSAPDTETQDTKAEDPASPDLKDRLIGDLKVEPVAGFDAWQARMSSRHGFPNLPGAPDIPRHNGDDLFTEIPESTIGDIDLTTDVGTGLSSQPVHSSSLFNPRDDTDINIDGEFDLEFDFDFDFDLGLGSSHSDSDQGLSRLGSDPGLSRPDFDLGLGSSHSDFGLGLGSSHSDFDLEFGSSSIGGGSLLADAAEKVHETADLVHGAFAAVGDFRDSVKGFFESICDGPTYSPSIEPGGSGSSSSRQMAPASRASTGPASTGSQFVPAASTSSSGMSDPSGSQSPSSAGTYSTDGTSSSDFADEPMGDTIAADTSDDTANEEENTPERDDAPKYEASPRREVDTMKDNDGLPVYLLVIGAVLAAVVGFFAGRART